MARSKWREIQRVVLRKREFRPDQLETTNLKRCLTRWDLTALGMGSTLGVGIYVLVGSVAMRLAGPSIVLSFLIAAAASLFAGLCYAELGGRVPRAGSSYIYTYVVLGELPAFFVGWNNILETMFGTASVARGLSAYVDAMSGGALSGWMSRTLPVAGDLAPHFDLFAFFAVLIFGVVLSLGVRESSSVNNVLAVVNGLVVLFIVVAGSFTADSDNWRVPASAVPAGQGAGGFFPFGALGTLRGAAVCFYGFVGFDTISSTGEEVKDPRRSIPFAILLVLTVVCLAYCSVSIVVTMMVPYYLQDPSASVAAAFSFVGWEWARWLVSVGAVFGMCASLSGAMFPLPRLLFAMGADGLAAPALARLTAARRSPAIATLLPALLIALLAAFLVLDQLVMMMCIGTLLSYTTVAICVIVLRYRSVAAGGEAGALRWLAGRVDKHASATSSSITMFILFLYTCACAVCAVCVRAGAAGGAGAGGAAAAVLLLLLSLQPQAPTAGVPFKTPFVPVIPCLSIFFNIHLMVFISSQTWLRIAIWMLIGIPVYILCVCCFKNKSTGNLEDNITSFSQENKNGKTSIQIVVESPTPPDTITRASNIGGDQEDSQPARGTRPVEIKESDDVSEILPYEAEEVAIQHAAVIETIEQKESKIIDMLDKVLQAEEDRYSDASLKEDNEDDDVSAKQEFDFHRKSFSELSNTGSDASFGLDVLSKYDVIAQVHREDLPRVTEERLDIGEADVLENNNDTVESDSSDDSETMSGTDESGYSDTLDKTGLNSIVASTENVKDEPYIPTPPPLDESFFANPPIRKSYTVPKRPSRMKSPEPEEENKPRESIKSNSSQGDGNLVFGTDRQINFLSKLNNIFQSKITMDVPEVKDEQRKRSNSTGNVVERPVISEISNRPSMFLDLQREISDRQVALNLRPVNSKPETSDEEDVGMSREDFKSKLENIYANGGPQLLKPRLMKSNPPAPEESYQTDASSTESVQKLPKMDKNDTLKRQKARFGEVLNSIRLSMNKDDHV